MYEETKVTEETKGKVNLGPKDLSIQSQLSHPFAVSNPLLETHGITCRSK